MTRQVFFVQGGGEGAHDEWDSKLVASLGKELGPNYRISYPLMPNESDPEVAAWERAIAEELASLGDGVILVGHSLGATILVDFLAKGEAPQKVGGVFLIAAPFVGEGGWPGDEIMPLNEVGAKLPAVPIYLYHGSDDETAPIAHLDLYAQAMPQAVILRLNNRNHQLNDDLSEVAADIKRLD
jgi:hypothetical protein